MRRRTIRLLVGAGVSALLAATLTLRTLEQRFDARIAEAREHVKALDGDGARRQLPSVALHVLARAGVEPDGTPRVVRIGETGEVRAAPDEPWKSFTAVQHLAVRDVGFVWHATMDIAPGIDIEILDQLEPGSRDTEVRLLGAIPLSSTHWQSLERAQVQRYLADLAWAPLAIRHNLALRFSALDDRKLEVSVGEGPQRASVVLEIDAKGDIIRSIAMRPHVENGTVVERRWVAELSRHDQLGAIRVPTYGEARWELPTGNFVYFRSRIQSIEVD